MITGQEFKRRLSTEIKVMTSDRDRAHNPGENFFTDWINKNAELFEKKWRLCKCRTCKKYYECGSNMLRKCKFYSRG